MTVLMFGSDSRAFEPGSETEHRMLEYGKIFSELHVIIRTQKQSGYEEKKLGKNVTLYPTNNHFKLGYWNRAQKIAERILGQPHPAPIVLTAQDPFETGIVALRIKKKYKIPLQIQVHTDFLSPEFARESWLNKARAIFGKRIVKRADQIRVVSDRIKQSLEKIGIPDKKITVLPIHVEIKISADHHLESHLKNEYHEYDFLVLMISRFTIEKNIPLALKAWHAAISGSKPENPIKKPLLLIVGDGPERSKLLQAIKNLRLENSVKIIPWFNNPYAYYKIASFYLLTSNYEGYGRTVIESLAVGTPVISTDVGIVNEVIKNGENGFVFPVRATGDLQKIFESLLTGQTHLKKLEPRNYSPFASEADYLLQYKNTFTKLIS